LSEAALTPERELACVPEFALGTTCQFAAFADAIIASEKKARERMRNDFIAATVVLQPVN
jgi:hypothetical protein